MKKILLLCAALSFGPALAAQTFDYDIDFGYIFDNAEHTPSKGLFVPSGTLHLADLQARAGLSFNQGKTTHRLLAGFDVAANMGERTEQRYAPELLLSYRTDVKTLWGNFSAIFGVFPRTFSEGRYNEALFSRETYFTDRNFEGMFFKYKENGLYVELGLDWMGMYGQSTRERFQIMSAGSYRLADWLSFGWDASIYHFACSEKLKNVVDNMMAHAYLGFTPSIGFKKSELSVGWIQKYDWDRAIDGSQIFNGGALASLSLGNWGFGIQNDFYFGQDLMPLFIGSYDKVYYKTDLYFGNRFYHTQIEGFSFYDMAEAYYESILSSRINLRVSFIFHIGNPTSEFPAFRGWQQMLTLRVNLDGQNKTRL